MPHSTCRTRKGILQVVIIILLTAFLSVSAYALSPTQRGSVGKDVSEGASLSNSTKLLQFKSGKHITAFQPGKVYIASFDHALSIEFVGSGKVEPRSLAASPERSGKGTALLGRVEYRNQWEGVTVRYDAVKGGIAESTYTIEPGADVKAIRLKYNVPAETGPDGSLIFKVSSKRGTLKETPPVAWQEIGGNKVPVKVAYTVREGLVGFEVGSYDPRHTLIIDPTYQWHTFYGQVQGDEGSALAVDGNGNVYVAGFSFNSLTPGTWTGPAGQAPLHVHSGGSDIMVMKLNSSGEYQWHTFYGDPDRQWANAIAVDGSGNVYVTGFTDGGQWAGAGGAAPIRMGEYDGAQIIVLKLNTNGAYQWHTFYGQWVDEGLAIAVNENGVFLTGYANGQPSGTWVDLPAALHAHSGTGYDLFVLKLNTAGVHQWHTFYGAATNNGYDEGRAIALDASGNIYVTGYSQLTWQGAGAVNPLHDHSYPGTSGKPDIFVLKLTASGAYQWHTFYGATYATPYWATGEFGNGIAVDDSGNVYVAGTSAAAWGAPLHPYTKGLDITVLKLNTNGVYQWHTFYGSEGNNYGHAIAVNGNDIFVAGDGWGTWLGNGGKPPAHPFTLGCGLTILKLNTSGAYQWHTFYDYSANITTGVAHGVGVDGDGNIYVSSSSTATWKGDGNTAPKHAYTGANDITVLKLDPVSTLTVQKSGTGSGSVTSSPAAINCGSTCSAIFADGTPVTLTATAQAGSTFIGWSGGGCSGTGTCSFTMNIPTTVTAAFNPALVNLTVTKTGTGSGTVSSSPSGINCGATCAHSFNSGTIVTLTATAQAGSTFIGWSGGGCSGASTCTITMSAATEVTAAFGTCTYTLNLSSRTLASNGGIVNLVVKGTGATKTTVCDSPVITTSDPSWITAALTTTGWKSNRGTVKVTIAKSTTSLQRNGSVAVADKTFSATQKPVLCNITKLLPPSGTHTAQGGPGFFNITLSAVDCAWTAASDKLWIVSDAGGVGSATVNYGVDQNTSGKRQTGKITVTLTANGKKRPYTVIQSK